MNESKENDPALLVKNKKSAAFGKIGITLSLLPLLVYSIIYAPISLNLHIRLDSSFLGETLAVLCLLFILPCSFIINVVGICIHESRSFALAGLLLNIISLVLAGMILLASLPVGLVG